MQTAGAQLATGTVTWPWQMRARPNRAQNQAEVCCVAATPLPRRLGSAYATVD